MDVNNKIKGNKGESIAAAQLIKKGYNIIDRNFRGYTSEIDLIAMDGEYLVFIEVKLRISRDRGMPCEAVDFGKQKRIIKAAKQYMFEKELYDMPCRFDVSEILREDGKTFFRHTENAFWQQG